MDKNAKNQIAKRLKEATNVLVTVSNNPSVDQLSAAIGLSLFLSKLKKHSTAVYSGDTPNTIGFLKPEETLEPTTDSLQDFIIALDKSKADKIRYKVEDDLVKIFITPYRSSVGEEDLQFSMGDFNVDVVVALGVHNKDDLDQAITSHGRILHDATVATVNTQDDSELGSLNWTNKDASSLCEMVVSLSDLIKSNALDSQMATALLTGIVSETERFSNEKTTSVTMNASAKLMAAGANQQLVATELEEGGEPEPVVPPERQEKEEDKEKEEPQEPPKEQDGDDGALHIQHGERGAQEEKPPEPPMQPPAEPPLQEQKHPDHEPKPKPQSEPEKPPEPPKEEKDHQVRIDPEGKMQGEGPGPMPAQAPPNEDDGPQIHRDASRRFLEEPPRGEGQTNSVIGGAASQSMPNQNSDSRMITNPPSMGSKLSAMSDDFYGAEENDEGPLSLPQAQSAILDHNKKNNDSSDDKSDDSPPKQPNPPNLDRAAEPRAPETPPNEPEPDEPKPEKESEKPPKPNEPSLEEKMSSKLPQSFVKSLDEKTLKDIESKTNSPHRTQVMDELKGKTLDSIEETVDSPHKKVAEEPPKKAEEEKSGEPKLDYEPHESEPPEKDTQSDKQTEESKNLAGEESKDDDPKEDKEGDESAATDQARKAVTDAINKGGDGRTALPALESIGSKDTGLDMGQQSSSQGKTVHPPSAPKADAKPAEPESAQQQSAPASEPEAAREAKSQYDQPSSKIHIDDDGNLSYGEKPPAMPPPLPSDRTASSSSSPGSAPLHASNDSSGHDDKKPPQVPPPMMPPA